MRLQRRLATSTAAMVATMPGPTSPTNKLAAPPPRASKQTDQGRPDKHIDAQARRAAGAVQVQHKRTRTYRKNPPPPAALLQSRSDTAAMLRVSIMTIHHLEQRGLLRTVKFAGEKSKVFHIVDEVKQLIESRARGEVLP
jgi:hypothetical protein